MKRKLPLGVYSKQIRDIRRKLELSQNKLAKLIGVSATCIIRWEAAKNNPSPLALEKLRALKKEMITNPPPQYIL